MWDACVPSCAAGLWLWRPSGWSSPSPETAPGRHHGSPHFFQLPLPVFTAARHQAHRERFRHLQKLKSHPEAAQHLQSRLGISHGVSFQARSFHPQPAQTPAMLFKLQKYFLKHMVLCIGHKQSLDGSADPAPQRSARRWVSPATARVGWGLL